jgi:hypothetical protein
MNPSTSMKSPAALAASHPHATIRSAIVSSITLRPPFPLELSHYVCARDARKEASSPRRMTVQTALKTRQIRLRVAAGKPYHARCARFGRVFGDER